MHSPAVRDTKVELHLTAHLSWSNSPSAKRRRPSQAPRSITTPSPQPTARLAHHLAAVSQVPCAPQVPWVLLSLRSLGGGGASSESSPHLVSLLQADSRDDCPNCCQDRTVLVWEDRAPRQTVPVELGPRSVLAAA